MINKIEAEMKVKANAWRNHFPMLQQMMHGKPLVYLDSGSSAQKPQSVLDAMNQFYQTGYANVHRGVYQLSADASAAYAYVRQQVQQFINASDSQEIIFTSGTTAAINLVAFGLNHLGLRPGDEIIISTMEHHANIVPWQVVCQQTGAQLQVIKMDDAGNLDLNHYQQLLSSRTRLVAVTHVSNVLGTINPVQEIIALAHQYHVPVLLDGAQAASHLPVDVQALDCDFYTFSAHKLYGPTGVGVLYGKTQWLKQLPPYQTGGDMIRRVTFEKTEYNDLPNKFEAGTPNIAGVVGLGAALTYLQEVGMPSIVKHEQALTAYAQARLQEIEGLTLLGKAPQRIGVFSWVMQHAHPHDIATLLDSEGIAVRAGHHCAMPLIDRLQVPATVRASLGLYNDENDIDALCIGLQKVVKLFG